MPCIQVIVSPLYVLWASIKPITVFDTIRVITFMINDIRNMTGIYDL